MTGRSKFQHAAPDWWSVTNSLLAQQRVELKHEPKINPKIFLSEFSFLEQELHQMPFNFKTKVECPEAIALTVQHKSL